STWATCSTTARHPPASATASTATSWSSSPTIPPPPQPRRRAAPRPLPLQVGNLLPAAAARPPGRQAIYNVRMNAPQPLHARRFAGEAVRPYLEEVARLRMQVFADWPYLYAGDMDYERDYLAAYA